MKDFFILQHDQQSSQNISDFLFYGFISSHPKIWVELFLEKFLFFGLCKFSPEK